jgi:hypothetical protein
MIDPLLANLDLDAALNRNTGGVSRDDPHE